jgi:hypothetical protein
MHLRGWLPLKFSFAIIFVFDVLSTSFHMQAAL